jgi:hypothetical protein
MRLAAVEKVPGLIEFVQGLPNGVKLSISLIIALVGVVIIYILWQKPAESTPEKQVLGATNQSGSAASSGQSGGITAGLYIQAPPVTTQQKAEALSSLESEIGELADFPNGPDIGEPRTLLEQHALNKLPHRLFIILNKYYKETLKSVPNVGEELFKYKKNYSNFENGEFDFENEVSVQIGKLVTVQLRQVWWTIYFKYFLLRSGGLTQQQVIDGGSFLNYGATWEEAERVFGELTHNPAIGPAMAEKFTLHKYLVAAAANIIGTYERP